MASSLNGNAVIGQSGGPTSVINQSLVGVIEEVQKAGHIHELLGARHGVSGIVKENFVPLKNLGRDLLEKVANTPAAALGSTRDKPDQEYCQKIFNVFSKNNVRFFFYIGGNDSADTARIVSDLAKEAKYDLRVFHVPKTIDNDLRVHDHTPGFGSAAKFVIAGTLGDNYDNKSLPGVKINVIMGRNAGFLTAASGLARHREDDGPHLIYVPEAPVTMDKFIGDVDRVYTKYGRCLVSVSEGIMADDGRAWAEHINDHLERDSHGNIQLSGSGALGYFLVEQIKNKLGNKGGKKLRTRSDTFGYLQRSFPGFVSEVDAREARTVGQLAVKYSVDNDGGSVAMRRLPGKEYAVEMFLTPLNTVAKETKHMAAEYIADGNNITQAFIDYCRPLVGTLPATATLDDVAPLKK